MKRQKKGTILKRYIASISLDGKQFEEGYPAYNAKVAIKFFEDKYPNAIIKLIDWKLV